MFLKTLSLKGFKSFANATKLELEPGVTVVVGPNGSGKSNVVDAIAWVLGAQRPSAIRSQKMDDVIFAGTPKMKPLGRAEVTLTIDNSAKLIPIDFEEVAVTRRLFRSGDSEYQINGVSCRLSDIIDLFSDTGVGRQQHVIVSQGRIDAVLNARPEERRAIIEEAAGVLKYRRRKEKSERRLDATEQNLTRLQDLLREVRRQLKPLERQANAARRHGEVISELTALRIFLAGKEIQQLQDRQQNASAEREKRTQAIEDLGKNLEESIQHIADLENELAKKGADDTGLYLARTEKLGERLRGADRLLAERIRTIDTDRNSTVDEAVISTLQRDAEQIRREQADTQARQKMLDQEASRVKEAEEQLQTLKTSFDSQWATGDINSAADELALVKGQLTAHERNRSQLVAERSKLMANSEKRRAELLGTDQEIKHWREKIHDCEQSEEKLLERLDLATERSDKAESNYQETREITEALRQTHASWAAKVEALTLALDEIRERSGAEQLAQISGVLGSVADLVDVDAGYEVAFSAALGDRATAVVTQDYETAQQAARALISSDTRALLLVTPEAKNEVELTPQHLLSHVRGRNEKAAALLSHHLASVIVSPDIETAIAAAKDNPNSTFVTNDGACFGPKGWRVGTEGLKATGAALDEATEAASTHFLKLQVAKSEYEAATTERQAAKADLAQINRELNQADDERVKASQALSALQTKNQRGDSELEAFAKRIESAEERLKTEDERAASLKSQIAELEKEEKAQHEQLKLMRVDEGRISEQAKIVAQMRNDVAVAQKAITDRFNFLQERLEDVESRLARHQAKASRTPEFRLAMANEVRVKLAARKAEIETWVQLLAEQRATTAASVKEITEKLQKARATRNQTDASLRSLSDSQHKHETSEAEIKVRLEAAIETLQRDFDCDVQTAIDAEEPVTKDSVTPKQRLMELEREVRIMGPINPLALEEFNTLNERHQFLVDQLDDVKKSRRELLKVIRAIDAEIVQVFSSAFADVSENFEALFSTLFPGGTGKLQLTSADDLLNTGIEVEAKPSGKNVRKLSLLSGGERSLTALAFLFAVFRSRPSPFYVMDEVEAALDDVNLHRFLGLVNEFRNEAQLIIVSHQKRTMEAADCLYGVTMKNAGSSRVVSERPGSDMSQYVDQDSPK